MNLHDLKLYQSNASPNSRRIRIYVAEKGIDLAMIPIDLGAKEQFSEAYIAINPRRVVPTLVLGDGTSIGEVPAIWRYLEEAYPENPLLGVTAKDKALVTMWERRADLEGFIPAIEAIRNKVAGLKGRAIAGPHDYEQIPGLVDRSRQRVQNFFADFDAQLQGNDFVAGSFFSAADITALAAVDFAAKALDLPIPDQFTALKRWHQAVSARPSATA